MKLFLPPFDRGYSRLMMRQKKTLQFVLSQEGSGEMDVSFTQEQCFHLPIVTLSESDTLMLPEPIVIHAEESFLIE